MNKNNTKSHNYSVVVPSVLIDGKPTTITESSNEKSKITDTLIGFTQNKTQIAEMAIFLLQDKASELTDTSILYSEAIEELRDVFKNKNLSSDVYIDKNKWATKKTRQQMAEDEEIMKKAIASRTIEKIIKEFNKLDRTILMPIEDFIRESGIISLNKTDGRIDYRQIFDVIQETSEKTKISYKEHSFFLSEDGTDLEPKTIFGDYQLIPNMEFVINYGKLSQLEKEEYHLFDSPEDFISSRIKNKDKYVEGIKIEFDARALALFAMPFLLGNYAITSRQSRRKFSRYAFFLDWHIRRDDFIRSELNKVVEEEEREYSIDEIMEMLGVNYKNYRDLKRFVLIKALREINQSAHGFQVELIEKKKKRAVTSVQFKVHKKLLMLNNSKSITLEYFIAVQHYYTNNYNTTDYSIDENKKIKTFLEYLGDIDIFCFSKGENLKKKYCSSQEDRDLALEEWSILHSKELLAWHSLLEMLLADEEWLEDKNATLNYEKLGLVDKDTNEYFKPIKGSDLALDSPSKALDYYRQTKKAVMVEVEEPTIKKSKKIISLFELE